MNQECMAFHIINVEYIDIIGTSLFSRTLTVLPLHFHTWPLKKLNQYEIFFPTMYDMTLFEKKTNFCPYGD